MRALCFCVIMISYLVFFMYISSHMIFLQQFGMNEHLLIFSRTTNCTRPTGSCNLLVLIYSKLFEIMWLPILICFSGPNEHHIDRRDYICLGQKQWKKIWERLKILDILSIFTVPIISGGWLLIFNIVFNHQANLPVMEDYRVIDNYKNNQTLLTNSALHKLRTHIHFTQLRFHCHKKNGSTFHIVTKTDEKGEAVIQYFTGQTETVPTSCGSFQKMEDDDSELAKSCSWWGKKILHTGLTHGASWGDVSCTMFLCLLEDYITGWQVQKETDGNVMTSMTRNTLSCKLPRLREISGGFLFVEHQQWMINCIALNKKHTEKLFYFIHTGIYNMKYYSSCLIGWTMYFHSSSLPIFAMKCEKYRYVWNKNIMS